jgi:hypothetical protein
MSSDGAAKAKVGKKKSDFKKFDLDGNPLGDPPAGPDKATAAKLLADKTAAANKDSGNAKSGKKSDPIVRNPSSEVDIAKIDTPVGEDGGSGLQTPKKGGGGDDSTSTALVRPKSAAKPRSLTRADTTQFEKDRVDEAAIHNYALNDEYVLLEKLIGLRTLKSDQGKNNIRFLDSRDRHGNTALMNACWKGNTFIAEFLLKTGASKDLQNYYGWTALMWAVANGREACVKLLLAWDVNVRILTPVDRAAIDFADNPEIRTMLQNVLNKPVLMIDGP